MAEWKPEDCVIEPHPTWDGMLVRHLPTRRAVAVDRGDLLQAIASGDVDSFEGSDEERVRALTVRLAWRRAQAEDACA